MPKKKRKIYSREFKLEAVGLITKKGYSIAEASRNLGIDYSVHFFGARSLRDCPFPVGESGRHRGLPRPMYG